MSWNTYAEPLSSMLEAIGRTPLVRLGRIEPGGHELLAKVEWYGPTGSVKDRIYAFMLERAERRGELKPGMTILECTTGNAGIACAGVAAIKGYPCVVIMPEGMGEERRKMIRVFGAELILTPGGESDIDVALARMEQMVKDQPGKYFVPAEFENPDNVEAHRISTGPEIWEQTGGTLDAVVAAQGTGGWITGVARFLDEQGSPARIYAVEPAECALISDGEWGPHGIAGIGDGIVPKNLDLSVIDGIVTVTTEESLEMARRLAREEGIFCGASSGCNVAAALVVAAAHPELRRIVTVIPDTGQRYFSSGLFGEPPRGEIPQREHRFDPRTAAQLRLHRDRLEFLGDRAGERLNQGAMSTDELPALGELPPCPNCGGRKWSLAGEIKRMSRGFLRGWNYVAELRCDACRTTIAAGWGGGGQLGIRDRIDARRLRHGRVGERKH